MKSGKDAKIEENRNITITVTQNAVHQVSFKVSKVTPGANGTSSTVTEQAPFLIAERRARLLCLHARGSGARGL